MTHRLIRRVLMVALLLFVPLVTSSAFAADIAGALQYVPKNSMAVVAANGDQLRKSPLWNQAQKLLFAEEPRAKKELAKLKKATGFDPWKNIHAVVVALGPNIDKDDDDFVIIAEASINEAKLIRFIRDKEGKIQAVNGPGGKHYKLGKKGDGRMAFRGKFIIIGGDKAFAAALKKPGGNKALTKHLNKFRARDVFAAMIPTAKIKKDMAREEKAFGKTKVLSAGLNVRKGTDLEAIAEFLTAAPAKKLAKLANVGLDEAKKARELKRMKLDGMINKISVAAQGNKLVGKLKLSQSDVKKLMGMLDAFL